MEINTGHRRGNSGQLPGLAAHLGYWLRRVSNHVSGEFARALQARRVSVAEWVALRLIQQYEKLTPAHLADTVGMTRGAVSKVVEKLEAKGWIARSTNPEDNRSQWLSLTRQGRLLIPKLAELADKNDKHFFGCLDKQEQAALRHLLQKLTDFHRFREVPVE
jgi:DNA-binding MarR family transcriptional regulator